MNPYPRRDFTKIFFQGEYEVVIKNIYLGVNAADITWTLGTYMPGVEPPFNCGFEGVGTVVAAGDKAKLAVGDHVCYCDVGAYTLYHTMSTKNMISPENNAGRS